MQPDQEHENLFRAYRYALAQLIDGSHDPQWIVDNTGMQLEEAERVYNIAAHALESFQPGDEKRITGFVAKNEATAVATNPEGRPRT